MRFLFNINELRTIATLAKDASEKMNEANDAISKVVSQHNWKCPERVGIDESLEQIKLNTLTLNEIYQTFAVLVTEEANEFTDFLNEKARMETAYLEDVASTLSSLGGSAVPAVVASGSGANNVVKELVKNSMHTSNVLSLHGANHGINLIDFSGIQE